MELIAKLRNKEIDCHKFLDEIRPKTKILNELGKYPENEECVICFMALYKRNEIKEPPTNLGTIKNKFRTLVDTENQRPDIISLFYDDCSIDEDDEWIFTFDALQSAADKGDPLAMYMVANNIALRRPNSKKIKQYYKSAADKGNRDAARKLAEICYAESGPMEQVNELYMKSGNRDVGDANVEMLHALVIYLNSKIKTQEQLITELLYEPGGRMYQKAKSDFESRKLN